VVFDNGFRVEPSVVFEGKTGSLPVPWPSSVPRRWQIAAVDRAGDLTSRGTIVGSFPDRAWGRQEVPGGGTAQHH